MSIDMEAWHRKFYSGSSIDELEHIVNDLERQLEEDLVDTYDGDQFIQDDMETIELIHLIITELKAGNQNVDVNSSSNM